MTPTEAGEEILRCIDYILTQFPDNQDRIKELDNQIIDINHAIEFTPKAGASHTQRRKRTA